MPATLDLTPDELLTTTRAVRKRLDYDRPVPLELVKECVEIAMQAPSGSNARGWHFMVVTDEAKRARISEIYREVYAQYPSMPISAHALAAQAKGDDIPTMNAVASSADALGANIHRAPVLVIPCLMGRAPAIEGPMGDAARAAMFGSVLPAFWNFMLAARARGLGTCWTTLHLFREQEVAEILGIPYDEVMQTALSPVAYTIGTDFKPAKGRGLETALHVDTW